MPVGDDDGIAVLGNNDNDDQPSSPHPHLYQDLAWPRFQGGS